MANITRTFIKGKMNKSVDERLVPDGEYINAVNVRMGSTEQSEIGVVENTKGNLGLTSLVYNGTALGASARTIGAFQDGANETLYWFVHDDNFAGSLTNKLDLIVSYDTKSDIVNYHLISLSDGGSLNTTLNFNPKYLITGVDKVNDLLFFTDNYNAPRCINVTKSYAQPNVSGIDYDGDPTLLEERLLVIKRPPLYAPTIELVDIPASQDKFLEDRYICFAYRYRYENGEYSATSPFSDPAFAPKLFDFSADSFLNEGMVNSFNAVNVSYNTGGPLVKSIDLLFKEAQSSVIKVMEKVNKEDSGLGDNATTTFLFSNSNIFTILPDSEILRLYDNVPRFALAQTIMGNRVIYGNYIDGYNLERDGNPTQIEYGVSLISEAPFGVTETGYEAPITYNIVSRGITRTQDSFGLVNLSTFVNDLKKGSVLTFEISFTHSSFGGPVTPSSQNLSIDISFPFTLIKDYTSVYELATSDEFRNSVGVNSPRNILDVYSPTGDDSCNGNTFTDEFNCKINNTLTSTTPSGSVKKFASGTSGNSFVGNLAYETNEAIAILASPSGILKDIIGFALPYVRFVDDVTNGANTTNDVYEFYDVTSVFATLQLTDSLGSLHSNRGYEIGMVYMDEYGRSSTAVVSENNSLSVPCSASDTKNNIQVAIPPRQIAPKWATNYKFVIKPDEENYDVIYSSIYYQSLKDSMAYFLLEGENSRKVEEGDRLLVKKDSSGVAGSCVYATVLEKDAYASEDIVVGSVAGTYMKINPNNLNIIESPDTYRPSSNFRESESECGLNIGITLGTTDNPYVDLDMPAGSTIDINIQIDRKGSLTNCPARDYSLKTTLTANKYYANVYDFLVASNFQEILDTGTGNVKYNWIGKNINTDCENNEAFVWYEEGDGATTQSIIYFNNIKACGYTKNKVSKIQVDFNIRRIDTVVVFETEPQDALPNVWFESADTYAIDSNGYHEGTGGVYQTSTTPAIINTDFYNCFSFGNGAESYKIRDSIVGKTFNLGNRIFSTSEKEYREAHRFADLTYSGVYNEENNVNKLNEFNLGLLNFKSLEKSFGPVQKLVGRETDILTLQEDKISYVYVGKDILSDAGGGSALVAVPEVLGKQIARVEQFGISNNPESFAQWGADKYFTDAKRGAVIQLKGSGGQNEQLAVVSEFGMRTWFRDLFNESFNTQKLGGFDPYMDEYVLTSNDILKPIASECVDCGISIGNIVVTELTPYEFCVNVGALVGDIVVSYTINPLLLVPPKQFFVDYTYNDIGYSYTSDNPPVSASFIINKNSVSAQTIDFTISNGFAFDKTIIESFTVGCPQAELMTIVPISLTNNADSGKYIHSEYSWTDGSFVSPLHSRLVEFASDAVSNPVTSDYALIEGRQGAGIIPSDLATISIDCNKINFDNFDFNDLVNNFRYFRSDTLYLDNDVDMQLLLAAATIATPTLFNGTNKYYANFAMPASGQYLYLIWDYRISVEIDLCSGDTLISSCCSC